MKKFRKISALMLALALICALSVSAFAAMHTVYEDYEGYEISMTREVNEYDASGTIVVDAPSGQLRRVTVEVWYFKDVNGRAVLDEWVPALSNSTYNHPGVTTEKIWTSDEIYDNRIVSLSYTITTFKAEVYARGTTMTYNSGPCYLDYLLQN